MKLIVWKEHPLQEIWIYNSQYKTTIYAQGNVGDIKFYTDVFIKDPIMAIYVGPENEEFLIDVDFSIIKEKGINYRELNQLLNSENTSSCT